MPRMTYSEKKAKHRKSVEEYLKDNFKAGESAVPLSEIKRLLHSASADALTTAIIAELESDGVITQQKNGRNTIVYLTEETKLLWR